MEKNLLSRYVVSCTTQEQLSDLAPSHGGVTQEEGWHFKYGKRHAALTVSPRVASETQNEPFFFTMSPRHDLKKSSTI